MCEVDTASESLRLGGRSVVLNTWPSIEHSSVTFEEADCSD